MSAGSVAVVEIAKEEWDRQAPPFTMYDALRVKHDGEGGYDFLLNVDNTFLLTELSRAKEAERPLIKFWFKYGLVLSALGMIKHVQRLEEKNRSVGKQNHSDDADEDVDTEEISRYCSGLAQVIIPIIRSLYRGPTD